MNKEKDVCPECGGDGYILRVNAFDEPFPLECEACNGTGKAPVDKIREAFSQWSRTGDVVTPSEAVKEWGIVKDLFKTAIGFYAGYKSQQAEIERLKGCINTALIIDAKDGHSMHPKACKELVNAIKEGS